jgi:hypothetical protein
MPLLLAERLKYQHMQSRHMVHVSLLIVTDINWNGEPSQADSPITKNLISNSNIGIVENHECVKQFIGDHLSIPVCVFPLFNYCIKMALIHCQAHQQENFQHHSKTVAPAPCGCGGLPPQT